MSGPSARWLGGVIRALGEPLQQGHCGRGDLAWLRPEIIDGFSVGGAPGRLHIRVHLAQGWPASVLPSGVQTVLGEVPLRAWHRPRPRVQCAALRGFRTSPAGEAPTGALGFLAVDQHAADRYFLVTAGHVLASLHDAGFNDRFRILTTHDGDEIGQAFLSETSITGGAEVSTYELDAGLLRVPAEAWRDLIRRVPAAVPPRLGQTPVRGDGLKVCLPGGEAVAGISHGMSSAMNLQMERLAPDGSTQELTIRVQSLLAARLDRALKAGDSGSSVRGADDALLGLHCAGLESSGDEANAWLTPARAALDYFGILPITRETLSQPLPVRPLPSLRAAVPRPAPAPVAAGGTRPLAAASRDEAVDTLARTLWAEARGEGRRGMEAVACVVMNRVHRQTWWGRNVVEVCRKPGQFSCWNPGTRALERLQKVAREDPSFAQAISIAEQAIAPGWEDFTEDACHYHTVDILPNWAAGQTPCFRLGRHVFYNRIR